ncbi:CHAT domain-containing protein [[Phormidium] sp. ETS-05]|uniref:CHAT domain-containing protein n=1 Tax=[Phormidium] sp. ETS-05 TaxID=222819 RepID=UPI001E5448FC|nr:CHAT domain-containing protein [[Phormidium] sp. ETS-05]
MRLYDPPVDLLVLSACRTAVGDEQSELGFAGLAVQAGVKTALASLWYVSDEGTLSLMTEFYRILKEAPLKPKPSANPKIAMIRNQTRIENGNLILENINETIPSPRNRQPTPSQPATSILLGCFHHDWQSLVKHRGKPKFPRARASFSPASPSPPLPSS